MKFITVLMFTASMLIGMAIPAYGGPSDEAKEGATLIRLGKAQILDFAESQVKLENTNLDIESLEGNGKVLLAMYSFYQVQFVKVRNGIEREVRQQNESIDAAVVAQFNGMAPMVQKVNSGRELTEQEVIDFFGAHGTGGLGKLHDSLIIYLDEVMPRQYEEL